MKKYIIFLFSLSVLFSCKPEFPSWEHDTVFPLADAKLYLRNIAGDSVISEGSDSLLDLYYDYLLTDFSIDSIISGLDTIAGYDYVSPVTVTISPGTQILNKSQVNKLSLDDVYLKTLEISDGILNLKIQNKYTQPIRFEFSIPEAVNNGIPFSVFREIPPAPSATQPLIYTEEITVTNFIWTFFETGPQNYNCYNSVFKVWLSPDATDNVQVNFNDIFSFFIGFNDLNISYARGYFGQHHFDVSQESDFDFFQNITVDEFHIEDVELLFEVTNTIGMDLQIMLTGLTGYNAHTGQSIIYNGPLLNTLIQIPRAQETTAGHGLAASQTYTYDLAQNSNLKQFIESLPGKLQSQVELEINPLGNISGGNDFYYGIPTQAKLSFRMPLHFSANNLTLSDTMEFSGEFMKEQIQSMVVKAIIMNCFPFEFGLTLKFLDSSKTELCHIPFDVPVKAAQMTSSGRTAAPEKSVIFLTIPNNSVEHIRNASFINIVASVSTLPYGENVKIYSDYYMDIKTFALLKLLIHSAE